MENVHTPSGRRRIVTPERIIDAGIALTLPRVTVKAVAARLGVSSVALYKHVGTAEELRQTVAEGILARQEAPQPRGDALESDLLRLALALRAFVHEYPGIAGYLGQIDSSSLEGIARIDEVMRAYSDRYSLTPRYAAWLVSTVSEHAIALAELIHVPGGRRRERPEKIRDRADLRILPRVLDVSAMPTPDDYFAWSMRAVIVGAIMLLDSEQG